MQTDQDAGHSFMWMPPPIVAVVVVRISLRNSKGGIWWTGLLRVVIRVSALIDQPRDESAVVRLCPGSQEYGSHQQEGTGLSRCGGTVLDDPSGGAWTQACARCDAPGELKVHVRHWGFSSRLRDT